MDMGGILPVKWHIRKKNMAGNNIFTRISVCLNITFQDLCTEVLTIQLRKDSCKFFEDLGFSSLQRRQKEKGEDFGSNHQKEKVMMWFGKRFAVIQEIMTFGIDIIHDKLQIFVRKVWWLVPT